MSTALALDIVHNKSNGMIAAPRRQPRHYYIDNMISEWLNIHYGDSSFNGRVVLGYKKEDTDAIYVLTARSMTELEDYFH